jgi:hypothetical protein
MGEHENDLSAPLVGTLKTLTELTLPQNAGNF